MYSIYYIVYMYLKIRCFSDTFHDSLTLKIFTLVNKNPLSAQVDIIGLTPELDALASPISSLLVNAVKRDLRGLVTPLIQGTRINTEGKGRHCWLGDVLECHTSHLAARMI